ncbi:Uncharacterised protein [Bordetella pertussis]|nr:Uncharacterised protein [Bordetella pertussis]
MSGSGRSDFDSRRAELACTDSSPLLVLKTGPSMAMMSPMSHCLKAA